MFIVWLVAGAPFWMIMQKCWPSVLLKSPLLLTGAKFGFAGPVAL
jgi:hypothetical protein